MIEPDVVAMLEDLVNKRVVEHERPAEPARAGPQPGCASPRPARRLGEGLPPPIGLLAELTHRCPLRCPYCSNPLELDRRSAELDTATWSRVFSEAAALGVLHVHLSGGEPTARADIAELTRPLRAAGPLHQPDHLRRRAGRAQRLAALAEAGLDHVQLSIQAADAGACRPHRRARRTRIAASSPSPRQVSRLGLPLTVNTVIHRANIGDVGGADRARRRAGRAPRRDRAHAILRLGVAQPRRPDADAGRGRAVDRHRRGGARRAWPGGWSSTCGARLLCRSIPRPACGGWGRRTLNVTPSGKVLPCHAAETIPGLEFWSRARRMRWPRSGSIRPAFNAFRGTAWMPEPCRSCDRRERDWGGCRCQAMALLGDAALTDPACSKSPFHARMEAMAAAESADDVPPDYVYRAIGAAVPRQEAEP